MFTIIYPSSWGRQMSLFSRVLATRKVLKKGELDDFDTLDTFYVSYEKESLGVFGSCRLNLLKNSPASSFYKKKFINHKSYLEVSLISFKMANNHWLSKSPGAFNRAKKSFFKGLYRTLTNLAVSMGFRGIVSLSLENDESDFLFLREWPLKRNYFFRSPDFENLFFISEISLLSPKREISLRKTG